MANVLFVCLHNAGRSQMARALFENKANDRHSAQSAGTTPASEVNPAVVEALHEVGIDISGRRPQKLTDDLARWADVVVTMGCGDSCPIILGKRYIDWELPDPRGMSLDQVREVRDTIDGLVSRLISELDGPMLN